MIGVSKLFEPAEVFKLAEGEELTAARLSSFLERHRVKHLPRYEYLGEAYRSDQEIFKQRRKDPFKPDNRVVANFAKNLVDTLNGFFLGIPIKVYSNDEDINNYIQNLTKLSTQDEVNVELSKMCDIYGRSYEICYLNEDAEIMTHYVSPRSGFMIYDESILERPLYFVRTYLDAAGKIRGSVSDSETVKYFKLDGELVFLPEFERPHGFDGVPAIEYTANAERQGLFEPVITLQNAYNKALSEKANDVDYFSDAYLKVLGAGIVEKDMQKMRDHRVINLPDHAGGVEVDFLAKPSADGTQENLLDRIERLIYQISMVANISDENFGNSSGIALRYKLQNMKSLAKNKELKFRKAMSRRYKLIFSSPLNPFPSDAWLKLEYAFSRDEPANLLEESQIVNNLSGYVSQETLFEFLTIVNNAKDELRRVESERAALVSDYGPVDFGDGGELG